MSKDADTPGLFCTPPPEEMQMCVGSAVTEEDIAAEVSDWSTLSDLQFAETQPAPTLQSQQQSNSIGSGSDPDDLWILDSDWLELGKHALVLEENGREHWDDDFNMEPPTSSLTAFAAPLKGNPVMARTHLASGRSANPHLPTSTLTASNQAPNFARKHNLTHDPTLLGQLTGYASSEEEANNTSSVQKKLVKYQSSKVKSKPRKRGSIGKSKSAEFLEPSDSDSPAPHAQPETPHQKHTSFPKVSGRQPRNISSTGTKATTSSRGMPSSTPKASAMKKRAASPLAQRADTKRPKIRGGFVDESDEDSGSDSRENSSNSHGSAYPFEREEEEDDEPSPRLVQMSLDSRRTTTTPAPHPARNVNTSNLKKRIKELAQAKTAKSGATKPSTIVSKAAQATSQLPQNSVSGSPRAPTTGAQPPKQVLGYYAGPSRAKPSATTKAVSAAPSSNPPAADSATVHTVTAASPSNVVNKSPSIASKSVQSTPKSSVQGGMPATKVSLPQTPVMKQSVASKDIGNIAPTAKVGPLQPPAQKTAVAVKDKADHSKDTPPAAKAGLARVGANKSAVGTDNGLSKSLIDNSHMQDDVPVIHSKTAPRAPKTRGILGSLMEDIRRVEDEGSARVERTPVAARSVADKSRESSQNETGKVESDGLTVGKPRTEETPKAPRKQSVSAQASAVKPPPNVPDGLTSRDTRTPSQKSKVHPVLPVPPTHGQNAGTALSKLQRAQAEPGHQIGKIDESKNTSLKDSPSPNKPHSSAAQPSPTAKSTVVGQAQPKKDATMDTTATTTATVTVATKISTVTLPASRTSQKEHVAVPRAALKASIFTPQPTAAEAPTPPNLLQMPLQSSHDASVAAKKNIMRSIPVSSRATADGGTSSPAVVSKPNATRKTALPGTIPTSKIPANTGAEKLITAKAVKSFPQLSEKGTLSNELSGTLPTTSSASSPSTVQTNMLSSQSSAPTEKRPTLSVPRKNAPAASSITSPSKEKTKDLQAASPHAETKPEASKSSTVATPTVPTAMHTSPRGNCQEASAKTPVVGTSSSGSSPLSPAVTSSSDTPALPVPKAVALDVVPSSAVSIPSGKQARSNHAKATDRNTQGENQGKHRAVGTASANVVDKITQDAGNMGKKQSPNQPKLPAPISVQKQLPVIQSEKRRITPIPVLKAAIQKPVQASLGAKKHAAQPMMLPPLQPRPRDAEAYFEYSIHRKTWLETESEDSVAATELSSPLFTNVDEANAQVEMLFSNRRKEFEQHFQIQCDEWSIKRDNQGCNVVSGKFAPMMNPNCKSWVKMWVQRDDVPAIAGAVPKEMKGTDFISKTIYTLRLFKLVVQQKEDDDEDTMDTDDPPLRVYEHVADPSFTTLETANLAALNLQIELGYEKEPKPTMRAWQDGEIRGLRQHFNSLGKEVDDERNYWSKTFNGSGPGSKKFELLVEKGKLCGPRNL